MIAIRWFKKWEELWPRLLSYPYGQEEDNMSLEVSWRKIVFQLLSHGVPQLRQLGFR